ncbi:hypothetical protein SISNIDRAFT_483777 [Sistotremastrum niveocremeum HHB9708]|uniref:Integral membrane protein n=1 Tax=Sistotremastrum niveocremeum HHB9708 TaxID=1314777 RepID=A0A164X173_9AGAM|nr:hypothetical protein SISNIDRAFT_483777 [Sistotremastrum niveocremeum HHB9708]
MSNDVTQIRSLETPGPPNPILISAFALLLTAQVGLTFLLLTLLLIKIRRALAFYNFIFITWVSTPIYLLLFYTKQYQVPHVPEDICAAQAILKHGVDSAFLSALFLLALESWKLAKHGTSDPPTVSLWRILVIALPYASFLVSSLAIFIRGKTSSASKYDVVQYSFYCTLEGNATLNSIGNVEYTLIMLGTVFCEVSTALVYRKMKKLAANIVKNDLGFSAFVRLGVFTFWLSIG